MSIAAKNTADYAMDNFLYPEPPQGYQTQTGLTIQGEGLACLSNQIYFLLDEFEKGEVLGDDGFPMTWAELQEAIGVLIQRYEEL